MRYLLFILLLFSFTAKGLDTGWLNPSATGIDYNQWTSPANAYSSNDNYTYNWTLNNKQDYYNFNVPSMVGFVIFGFNKKKLLS